MQKLILIFSLLTFSICTFAQTDEEPGLNLKSQNGIDFIILEMKLGAVLGGFKDGKFVNAETAAKGITVNEDYTLFGFNVSKKDSVLKLTKQNEAMEEICPDYVSIETNSKANSGVALSSNARWNPMPRIPIPLDSNSKVYSGIVGKFLISKGIKKPTVKIKQILKVDLEGDGKDEVIIHAENRAENSRFETKAGDYSFILLRKIVDGKVKNLFLTGEVIPKKIENTIPYNFELSAILDLDADGKMEIVTYGYYYEGAWSEAFQIKDGEAKKILETGCGV